MSGRSDITKKKVRSMSRQCQGNGRAMSRQGPEKVNTRSGQVDGKVKAKARSMRGQAR